MMGDYIGPPEGSAENRRVKGKVMVLGLSGFSLCVVAGSWLVTRRDD